MKEAEKKKEVFSITVWQLIRWTFKDYPASVCVAIFAVLFSIFVFALCGFHSFVISQNQTTQEKLKHTFDKFSRSPYSYGRCLKDWSKVICCPKRANSRISHALVVKSSDADYEEFLRTIGGRQFLPD